MSFCNLKFKSRTVFQNAFYVAWDDTLIELLEWIIDIEMFKTQIVITSAYRPDRPGRKPSVHGTDPLRGLDLHGKGPEAIKKTDYINKYWEYNSKDPSLQVAMVHDVGRGEHIHLQVHPNTVIIKGGYNKWP